jgi:hypothetical protein
MGGKSLMKKIVLIIMGLTILMYADLSVESIKNMVNSIHQKRQGVKLSTLETTVEPFVRLEVEHKSSNIFTPKAKKTEIKLTLHAIMNGKAFINDKWLNKNDNIRGYIVKYIGSKGVVLRNENRIKKLFLSKIKKSYIKIEEKN